MKWRLEMCPNCKEETPHRVRKRVKPTRDRGAIIKRIVYHCTKCNIRRRKQ